MPSTSFYAKTGGLILWLILHSIMVANSQSGDYYSIVNEAENEVLLEKYGDAIPLYKKAFEINPMPFPKDLHNALLCSIKSEDEASSKAFIDKILQFDIDTIFYHTSDKLQELHASSELYGYFNSQLKNRVHYFKMNCRYYDKLFALDQTIRQTCKEINTNYYAECGEEIKLLDSLNLLSLQKHFNAYGVPCEVEFCQINPSAAPPYLLVVKHNMQWARNSLDSILLNAINDFRLHPQLYSDMVDYYNESTLKKPAVFGLGYNIKLGDRLFVWDVPAELKSTINASRNSIHLDSIEVYNAKVIFQYRHPEFLLIYPQLLATLDAGPEMEKELAEKWKDIEVFRN